MSVPHLPPLRQPKSSSLPVLRQPKFVEKIPTPVQKSDEIIVTLKSGSKLMVSSDAYHGILTAGGRYQCAFCAIDIKTDGKWKDVHKFSHYHKSMLENSPYVEVYINNFIRPINPECYYCTTCNAIVSRHFIIRHLASVVHCQELSKAKKLAG